MLRLLLATLLATHGAASQIPCGKSSFPCAEESAPPPSTPVRVYGVPNLSPGLPRPRIPEPMVRSAALEAQNEVEGMLDESKNQVAFSHDPMMEAMNHFVKMHGVNQFIKAQSIPAYVSTTMTRKLLKMGLRETDIFDNLDESALQATYLGRTCHEARNTTCPATFYRSYSGQCNNVQHAAWGQAMTQLQRFGDATYSDSVSAARDSKTGKSLPNERAVSLELFAEPSHLHDGVTLLAAYWMQLVAGDLAESAPNQFILNGESHPFPCCSADFKHVDCASIHVSPNDPVYNTSGVQCIPFTRTLPAQPPHCRLSRREQANQASSYLDASFLYGNNKDESMRLRGPAGKLLNSGPMDFLPWDSNSGAFCRSVSGNSCFLSGSRDVNMLPGVTALHTVWHRQHNRIATTLKRLNPRWNDERIFEEARKVVIAQFQHVTFAEFLPVVMGQEAVRKYQLAPKSSGYASDYDMSLNGATLNEFAVLASSIGFSWLSHVDELGRLVNNPDLFYARNGFEKLVHELVSFQMETPGLKMTSWLRGRFMAKEPGQPGLDLAAWALKQGRDHGVPSYTTIRRQCGLGRVYTFNDLRDSVVSFEVLQRMSDVYDSVDDIDLLVGVLAEKPKKGALVGPTLSCIMGVQFYRLSLNLRRTLPDGEVLPKLSNDLLEKLLPDVDVNTLFNNFTALLGEGLDECLPRNLPCDHTSRYRSFDGWCNNLKHPEFGNAFTPLQHLLKPVYEDGFDAPRSRARSGRPLPNPRLVSNTVHADVNASHVRFTHMIMQFGQFVDHELTHSPVARAADDSILNCTRCDSPRTISQHCMPLRVEPGDPHFPTRTPDGEPRCLPFARSLLGQVSLGYRAQINQLTAFLDGSAIYGSTACEANNLRMFSNGLLNFTNLGDTNPMALPQGEQEKDCQSLPRDMCFVAGDERNSHQPGLTMMHTFWLREHNRLARGLARVNPHWADERLFQETRRIQVAQLQHVVFAEFLPKLLGADLLSEYDLVPLKSGYYTGYDDTCNAAISQPFATAAFRFGHTLVRQLFPRMDAHYQPMAEPVDLAQHFGNVGPIYNKSAGGMESLLMGLLGTPAMAFDRHITSALRNHLFERHGLNHSGLDLVAVNLLRARDHGVQPYNDFRPLCGLPRARAFDDLLDVMDPSAVAALKSVYEHVDDIDLFPGLTSERPRVGALLAPTMSCILAEQFRRLKRCDRFYYENDNAAARFTPAQLQEIRKIKLANIFCQNSFYLKYLQPNVFDLPDDSMNAHLTCDNFDKIDLNFWKETNECHVNGLKINRGESRRITACMSCTCTADGAECGPVRVTNCPKLLQQYDFKDIKNDVSCITQCAELFSSIDAKNEL